MLRTNCKEVREAVRNYLLECEDVESIKEIKERFLVEKDWQIKRDGINTACIDWLRGLGANVDYYYVGERKVYESWVKGDTSELSDTVLDGRYWYLLAREIVNA